MDLVSTFRTVRRGFSEASGFWNTSWVGLRSSVWNLISPSWLARPAMARPRVVLPLPDPPTRPTTSPRPMVNDTSRRTGRRW